MLQRLRTEWDPSDRHGVIRFFTPEVPPIYPLPVLTDEGEGVSRVWKEGVCGEFGAYGRSVRLGLGALAALQFGGYGGPQEVGLRLALRQDRGHAVKRPLRQGRHNLVRPFEIAPHFAGAIAYDNCAQDRFISHMTY